MTKRKSVGWAIFFVLMVVLALQLPRTIGHVYYLAGLKFYSSGHYQAAAAAFEVTALFRPRFARGYIELGSSYLGLGKYGKAEQAFLKAISIQDDSCASCGLGTTYYHLRRYDEAEKTFARAIILNPDDACAYSQSGKMYYDLGRYQEAVDEYKQVIDLNPNDEKAHYALALVYVSMRNKPAAVEQFKILQAINPNVAAELFEKSALLQGREIGKERLYFIPVGNFSKHSLIKLVTYCTRKSGVRVTSTPALSLEFAAINTRRRQLIAEEAIALMKRRYPQLAQDPNAILIGLTQEDMYIRDRTWQFAFSYRTEGRFAVVSSAHMNPVNLGEAVNDDLLNSRIRKMVMKNIGLLYYLLPVNNNPKSVLYGDVSRVEDLDRMGDDF